MGWSTELFCNISFNKETFNTIYEVQNRIDEIERCLKVAKDSVRDLVMITEPNKFCSEDDEPLDWLSYNYRANMELIEEYTIELYKLRLLLENWDACHNKDGLAIDPIEGISWDTAFLDGDFVRTVSRPNANDII